MSSRVTHKRSKLADALEQRTKNLDAIGRADADALAEIEDQNAGIKFDLGHRHSVVSTQSPGVTVGSKSETYAELMEMDGDKVADVYREALNDGT